MRLSNLKERRSNSFPQTSGRRNSRRWLSIITGLLALAVFLFSVYNLVIYFIETRHSQATVDSLVDVAIQMASGIEASITPSLSVESDLMESPPLSVDFNMLWEENKDIVAWIYCPDTPIHYPIVQSEDNSYYLRRLTDGTWNTAGTLFLDYRCNSAFTDFTSVVYGHNMNNDTMFGTLPEYRSQEYYEEHPVMYLLTPKASYRVDLFAGYVTSTDSEVYRLEYTEEEKISFLERSKALSDFSSSVETSPADSLLVLSTCSYEYENARYVLIGRLCEIASSEEKAQ